MSRRHRWIRGDWQIARWMLPSVPAPGHAPGESRRKNPLSLLSRWKIFDNLRRSLVPAALTLLLLLGWTLLSPPWLWTLAGLGTLLVPPWISSLLTLFRKPGEVLISQHLAGVARSVGRHSAQAAFSLACLPYEAFFSLDAIVRTAVRMLVTHTRLLEWNPSGDADRTRRTGLAADCGRCGSAPSLPRPQRFIWHSCGRLHWPRQPHPGPLDRLPALVWWLSRPLPRRAARLTADQTVFLRKLSRKTWAFFETFVGPEDHWLPPDNVQEHPVSVVAHRTSPTNMGLALLANLSAYDFGYLSAGRLVERTTQAFQTMAALERYRGHFYNWYDTQSLRPLPPLYLSSVDSGNLAGHLLTLRPGLLALPDQQILGARCFDGLGDTLGILVDVAAGVAGATPARLAQLEKELAAARNSRPTGLAAARLCLDRLATSAGAVVASLEADPGALQEPGAGMGLHPPPAVSGCP